MTEAPPNPVHAKLIQLLGERGPIDAVTLSDLAGVPYSTTSAKLRKWADNGEIVRIKGVGKAPNTFALLDTTSPELDGRQRAEPDVAPEQEQDTNAGDADPAEAAQPGSDIAPDADATEPDTDQVEPAEAASPKDKPDGPAEPTAPEDPDALTVPIEPEPKPESDNGEVPDQAVEPKRNTADKALRRPPGAVRDAALRVLRANPESELKVIEVARLIAKEFAAAGDHGHVSSGAVVNALNKFCGSGEALRTVDKPATYKAA
ncbi:hypothetical protein AB0M43_14520 [Longispora sp. NPDC051575]|uniref:hypothetical protein n=1 Tax=Longispora sp. NPDC051575 TaxID=3154943 RepID=UPI003426CCC4